MTKDFLRTTDICKSLDGHAVLSCVSFAADSGEIHAVAGENAAGKTTFARILCGDTRADSGEIFLCGKKAKIKDISSARRQGIFMVHQELAVFPDLTVYENVTIGNEDIVFGSRVIAPSKAELYSQAEQILAQLHLPLDLRRRAKNLSDGEIQLIKLARTVLCRPKILILDEITASLTETETRTVFGVLERLKAEGTLVIVITHSASLIERFCDKVTLLSNGRLLGTYPAKEIYSLPIMNIITGKATGVKYPRLPVEPGGAVLRVDGLCTGLLSEISFTLHQGEMIGIAGLVGSGRTTLLRTISNLKKPEGGSISFLGESGGVFGVIPENCREAAIFPDQSVARNITVSNLKKVLEHKLVSSKKELLSGRDYAERLGIKCSDITDKAVSLSTGNKQKVVIARSLFSNSNIFVFDEPTKNIDSAGKVEIYNLINALMRKGGAVLMISSDFSELIGMCRRVIVLKDGKQIGDLECDGLTEEYLYSRIN